MVLQQGWFALLTGVAINPFIFRIEPQIFRIWSAKKRNLVTLKLPSALADLVYNTHRKCYLRKKISHRLDIKPLSDATVRTKLLQCELLIKKNELDLYLSHYDKERFNEELFERVGRAHYPYIYSNPALKLGFGVKWLDPFTLLLKNGRRSHVFQWNTIPSLTSMRTAMAAVDKNAWSRSLELAGFPVVTSIQATIEELAKGKISVQYPIVIKPSHGTVSTNVFCDIKDERTLKFVLNYLSRKSGRDSTDSILVQPFIEGRVVRWCFFSDDPTDIIVYEWPMITGDGVKTISKLVSELTDFWSIEHNKVFLAELLKRRKLKWNSVLKKNQPLLLNKTGSPGSGGPSFKLSLRTAVKGTKVVKSAMELLGIKYGTIEAIVPRTGTDAFDWGNMRIIDINTGSVPDPENHEKFLQWVMSAKSTKPLKKIDGDRLTFYKKNSFTGLSLDRLEKLN